MDKAQLNRHDLVYISQTAKQRMLAEVAKLYQGEQLLMIKELFSAEQLIPGIVRRAEELTDKLIPLGFVHPKRLAGNRLRVASFSEVSAIEKFCTPYQVLQQEIKLHNRCLQCLREIVLLSNQYQLEIGVLGSAALELVTGLRYTDNNSDLDLLIKPAAGEKIKDFYKAAQNIGKDINIDLELALPNGYGIKVAELFRDTQTVLGKSLKDVRLLSKQEILKYIK